VSLKNLTIALIILLAYEILLKLSHVFIPFAFNISLISSITRIISFMVGVVIILFIFLFYKAERSNRKLAIVLKIVLGCIILHFILRLPMAREMIDHKVVRLVGELVGFVEAIFLFLLMIFYKKGIPANGKAIKRAANFAAIMFSIGIIKSLSSLITFTRYVISGIETDFSPIFYNTMLIIFIFTQASVINFLFRYYQFKFTVK
jgi:hypothetical protein